MKQHLLLIDGMALLFRAFYATSVRKNFMYTSKGIPTNAIQGYLKHIFTAIDYVQPSHIAVCWDMGSKTFRNDLFNGYKANREAPPIEMLPQFDLSKEITEALQIQNIGLVGYEADDCIGTIAHQLREDYHISVLTGDRDLLQILDEKVHIMLMQKGYGNYQIYTPHDFLNEYTITPTQFVDVKALMGDSSDGYPGVKGIGEKTAIKLMKEYDTIDNLLVNLHQLTLSVQKKIVNDLEMLHLSRKLAKIECNVPLDIEIDRCFMDFHHNEVIRVMEEYELKSVRNHLMTQKDFYLTQEVY